MILRLISRSRGYDKKSELYNHDTELSFYNESICDHGIIIAFSFKCKSCQIRSYICW